MKAKDIAIKVKVEDEIKYKEAVQVRSQLTAELQKVRDVMADIAKHFKVMERKKDKLREELVTVKAERGSANLSAI